MGDDARCIDVQYLARLVLQFENSEFMLDKNLVRCQESLPIVCCADASTICVAWGRRIVVLPSHSHTHPLFFAAAVTPSTGEMVTSMCCFRLPGSDDVMILVGTSEGYLQVHYPTEDGRDDQQKLECIHRQRVHHRALSHMSMSCDSSTVCMTSIEGIVVVDVLEILSARQWWLRTGRESTVLEAHAYETYTVGPRHGTVIMSRAGSPHVSLYDVLRTRNKRNDGNGVTHANDGRDGRSSGYLSTVTAMSIGRDPPIAWFKLDKSAKPSGIISSLVAMSSKMLFGRGADGPSSGMPERASRANSGTHVIELPDETISEMEEKLSKKEKRKLRGELVSPLSSVWDEKKRGCFGLVCWLDRWAACCDTLGRVMVIDIHNQCVMKMIKGYRECHLAWSAGDGEVLLLIYAPKRRSLEMWDVCSGLHEPRSRIHATNTGILIPSDAGVSFLFDYGNLTVREITSETFSHLTSE